MCRKFFPVLKNVVAASLVASFVVLVSTTALAHNGETHSPSGNGLNLEAALHWLASAQRADGRIVGVGDIATDTQATSEALFALSSRDDSAVDVSAALSSLRSNTELLSTEQLSRLLIALVDAGQSTDSEIAELLARRGDDGGFAHLPGYDSTSLDTAYALLAMQAANADASVAGSAIGFLSSAQLDSGAFGLYAGQPSILATALAIKALKPYLYTYNIAEPLSRAIDVLYDTQLAAGGWGADWENALVLQAVVPVTTDVTRYSSAVGTLKNNQSPEGDWGQRVYTTSLALSALTMLASIDVPADPEKAVVAGSLVDAVSGTAIPGASIDLMAESSGNVTLNEDGSFVIANLEPDSYVIAYSAPGYLGASQNLILQKGQFLNVGTIRLSVAPTATLVKGTLTDSASGLPVANAAVVVTVDGVSNSTTSDDKGNYQLLGEVGQATLTVSSSNHYGVSATAELAAGTTIQFSPALTPRSETLPSSSSLRGLIVDSDDDPVEAVTVRIVETGEVSHSDVNGEFTFSGLGGALALEIAKAGYETVNLSLVVPEKTSANIGRIQLREQVVLPSTSLSGRVIDMSSGEGVSGASVVASGQSATTDNNGFYHLSSIEVLDFVVSVNAQGYLFTDKQITLSEHTDLPLDIHIRQADLGGIEVARVTTDKFSYAAYEPVLISVNLRNDTILTQSARLYVQVKNAGGETVASFSGAQLPPLDPQSDPEELTHYQEHLDAALEELSPGEERSVQLEQWWNTLIAEPGTYIVTVQALDGSTSNLVSEKSTTVVVEETRAISSLASRASPGYVLLNNRADVELYAEIHNRANVAVEIDFDYALVDPTGNIVEEGMRTVVLQPVQANLELLLATFSHSFAVSGDYRLELKNISGATVDQLSKGVIFVPPSIRLEATQSLSPTEVVPLEGIPVTSGIQVKGVDSE